MLLSQPPDGRIVEATAKRRLLLLELVRAHGYAGCSQTRYPDDYELKRMEQEYPEFYAGLPEALKRRPPQRAIG